MHKRIEQATRPAVQVRRGVSAVNVCGLNVCKVRLSINQETPKPYQQTDLVKTTLSAKSRTEKSVRKRCKQRITTNLVSPQVCMPPSCRAAVPDDYYYYYYYY